MKTIGNMDKYFNVYLEFDKGKVDHIIQKTIDNNGKGYVCSVERNIMASANKSPHYLRIVNGALVNICDGAFVAKTIGLARQKIFPTYVGADLFIEYISKRKYTQYFLGNTNEILRGLRGNLVKYDNAVNQMQFQTLPFMNLDEFDYQKIGARINKYSPDIIWVSLGAPKQEEFMSLLLPHISKGIMFGFGAIFNFYSGLSGQRRAPNIFLKFNLEWLYRIYQDPIKNIRRNLEYLLITPKLIWDEKQKGLIEK
jgi:N-acetylglucosaminyldiphosphoundecaprenol N-acetyl-beta-D-mannosaminyltransferase